MFSLFDAILKLQLSEVLMRKESKKASPTAPAASLARTSTAITLAVPADWKQEEPSNNLRLAQFKVDPVPGDKEAADLVVSDPVQAGVMAVMAVAETAKFTVERLRRRIF